MDFSGQSDRVRLVYVLTDASGSSRRAGFNAGWNRSLPGMVQQLEQAAGQTQLCLISYGSSRGVVRLHLTRVADIEMIPTIEANGLSSLAAGLATLAHTIGHDCQQLADDGVGFDRPVALVVADDLSADAGEQILQARQLLREVPVGAGPQLHVAVPAQIDALSLAGLDARVHRITTGSPEQVAESLQQITRSILASQTED